MIRFYKEVVRRKSCLGTHNLFRWKVVLTWWARWLELVCQKTDIISSPKHQKMAEALWCGPWFYQMVSKILTRDFKSQNYLGLLMQTVVSICKLNYGNNFFYQQDNSRIHNTKVVKEWMTKAQFPVIDCPARSSDLNIMENIWKMLQDIIYDRLPIRNIGDLTEEIEKAIFLINATKKAIIKNLYDTFRTRLIHVIKKKGNEINV